MTPETKPDEMKPFQNFGKEQKLLSTKARLVVLDVLFSAVCQKLHFLSGTEFEILLAAVHLTLKVIGTQGALTVCLSHRCL